MKILFFLILLYFNNLGTILNANQFDFKIEKEEKELIEIFETICNKLLNNLKFEKVKNWELQNISDNSIFVTNSRTLQGLFIKIVKRGANTKAYRFTFNNAKGAKFFITSNSDCKVNMARIIQRNKLNQIIALVNFLVIFKILKK